MSFTDYDVALAARDAMAKIADTEIDKMRPEYVYGVVTAIGSGLTYAMVLLPGDTVATKVLVGSRAPTYVGQVVRVAGHAGDKHIDDVIGDAYNTVTGTVVVGSYRGQWSSSTTYAANEMASYGGQTWASRVAGNLNNLPAEGTYWTLVAAQGGAGAQGTQGAQGVPGPGLVLRRAWDVAATYAYRDEVNYGGSSWASMQDANVGHAPAEDTYWTLIASKGDPGADGLQGAGLVLRGPWSSAATYAYRDMVTYGTGSWASQVAGNINHVPVEGTYWTLVAGAGINWRGGWDSTATYAPLDAVAYGGRSWLAKVTNTNVQPVQGATWDMLSDRGLNWKGTYLSGTTYTIDDAVAYNGSSYVSLTVGNAGHTPASSPTFWDLLASKGDVGNAGSAGAVGPAGPSSLGMAPWGGPKVAAGEYYVLPAYGPNSSPPSYHRDTIFIADFRDEAELIERRGRLVNRFGGYFLSHEDDSINGSDRADLVDGKWYPGVRSRSTNGQQNGLVIPLDGLVNKDQFTIEFDLLAYNIGYTSQALATNPWDVFLAIGNPNSLQFIIFRDATNHLSVKSPQVGGGATVHFLDMSSMGPDDWRTISFHWDGTNASLELDAGQNTLSSPLVVTSVPPGPFGGEEAGLFVMTDGVNPPPSGSPKFAVSNVHVRRWKRNANSDTGGAFAIFDGPTLTCDAGTAVTGGAAPKLEKLLGLQGITSGFYFGTAQTEDETRRGPQLDAAQTAGLRYIRLSGGVTHIAGTVSGSGGSATVTYNWTEFDTWITPYLNHNFKIVMGCDYNSQMTGNPQGWGANGFIGVGGTSLSGVPNDTGLYAKICSDMITHMVGLGANVVALGGWNEPEFSSYWAGTQAQYVTLWTAIAQRMATDHPTLPMGTSHSNFQGGNAMLKAIIAQAQTSLITLGPIFFHDYVQDLSEGRRILEDLKSYATSHGVTSPVFMCTECDLDLGKLDRFKSDGGCIERVWGHGFQDELRSAYAFAHIVEMLNFGASYSQFAWIGAPVGGSATVPRNTYATANQANSTWAYWHWALLDGGTPTRPMSGWDAHLLLWKLNDCAQYTVSSNWPGVRAILGKQTSTGRIVLMFGCYRPFDTRHHVRLAFNWTGLPSTFTWVMYKVDKSTQGTGKPLRILGGDQTNLPIGQPIDGLSVYCIEITP